MSSSMPIIGIPMGDPSGVGPEIIVKALADGEVYKRCMPVVVGDVKTMRRACEVIAGDLDIDFENVENIKLMEISHPKDGVYKKGYINIIQCGNPDVDDFVFGKVCIESGKYAFECIKMVTGLALSNRCDAVATPPINKEAIRMGEIKFIGHTEMFAGLTGTHDPLTMFQVKNMRVFFLTRHVSLRNCCDMVKYARVQDYIVRCTEAMKRLGLSDCLLAVAGLNPHNGENGMFGDEEGREIVPAIEYLQNEGYNVVGPVPPDSVFHQALQGKYDAVLSMYHDQGHIATKTVDFERTIALTLGLPFLRTSVDHGTAFDIAGTGKASGVSMKEAILMAASYAPSYNGK